MGFHHCSRLRSFHPDAIQPQNTAPAHLDWKLHGNTYDNMWSLTALAHQCHLLPFLDRKRDALQDCLIGPRRVGKADISKRQRTLHGGRLWPATQQSDCHTLSNSQRKFARSLARKHPRCSTTYLSPSCRGIAGGGPSRISNTRRFAAFPQANIGHSH